MLYMDRDPSIFNKQTAHIFCVSAMEPLIGIQLDGRLGVGVLGTLVFGDSLVENLVLIPSVLCAQRPRVGVFCSRNQVAQAVICRRSVHECDQPAACNLKPR